MAESAAPRQLTSFSTAGISGILSRLWLYRPSEECDCEVHLAAAGRACATARRCPPLPVAISARDGTAAGRPPIVRYGDTLSSVITSYLYVNSHYHGDGGERQFSRRVVVLGR